MTTFQIISVVLMGFGVLITLMATIFALRNLKLIVKVHADNHEWNRRIATQGAITKLRDVNIDELNKEFGYANQLTPIALDSLNSKFQEKPELQILCHKLLNFNEGLASGIHLGIYDELTVKISRKGLIERDFVKFHEYIVYRRNIVGQALYSEQEELITKWRKEALSQSSRNTTGSI